MGKTYNICTASLFEMKKSPMEILGGGHCSGDIDTLAGLRQSLRLQRPCMERAVFLP